MKNECPNQASKQMTLNDYLFCIILALPHYFIIVLFAVVVAICIFLVIISICIISISS